ncbi:hypothetical protein V8E36_003430 [Tilletia maclaganii]
MSDHFYRPSMMPPFTMGAFHGAPVRRGVYLYGPDRRTRLIQLPNTFAELVSKAANMFGIDRSTHDVRIVMAEQDDCEIEEDTLPVLHDRERLIVRAISHTAIEAQMRMYSSLPPLAGPSQRSLPSMEPPPAPSPGLLLLEPEDLNGDMSASLSSSQTSRLPKKAPLPSAMKVKTCPTQAQAASGSTGQHALLNASASESAPIRMSQASTAASAPAVSSASSSSGSSSSSSSVPSRRKRDIRKDRKKHVQDTIARENSVIQAEVAAAAAQGTSSPSTSRELGDSSTPTSSQSRRRIAFAGIPDDSDELDSGADTGPPGFSPHGGVPIKAEKLSPVQVSGKLLLDSGDSSDDSQESPAKRRKLNADAKAASRQLRQKQGDRSQQQQQGQEPRSGPEMMDLIDEPSPSQGSTAKEDTTGLGLSGHDAVELQTAGADAEVEAANSAETVTSTADDKEAVMGDAAAAEAERSSQAPKSVTSGDTVASRAQVSPRQRSPKTSYIEVSDSEEEEIYSPSRQTASQSSSRSSNAPQSSSQSPKLHLPLGRPPVDPKKRAEYDRIKEEIRLRNLAEKGTTAAGTSPQKRRQSSPSSSGGNKAPESHHSRTPSGATRRGPDSSPKGTPASTSSSSNQVVNETPPVSPNHILKPIIEITAQAPAKAMSPAPVATPSSASHARSGPKKAPASRGGVGATARPGEHASTSEAQLTPSKGNNGTHTDAAKTAPSSDARVATASSPNESIRTSANVMMLAALEAAKRGTMAANLAEGDPSTSGSDAAAEGPTPTKKIALPKEPVKALPSPAQDVATSTSAPLAAAPKDPCMERAYKQLDSMMSSIMNHPSNGFVRGEFARDFTRFCNEYPQGGNNLLTIRKKIELRSFHEGAKGDLEVYQNFKAELKDSFANMRAFFGAESQQAKNVEKLERLSFGVLNEWLKQATTSRNGSGSQNGNGAEGSGAVSGGAAANGIGASLNGAISAGYQSFLGLSTNGNGRTGSSSGRSTPVLDAKAIQNAARNGGELPAALGLSSMGPGGSANTASNALRVKGTTSGSRDSSSSGTAHWHNWLRQTMPGRSASMKATGSSPQPSTTSNGGVQTSSNSSNSSNESGVSFYSTPPPPPAAAGSDGRADTVPAGSASAPTTMKASETAGDTSSGAAVRSQNGDQADITQTAR